MKIYTDLNKVMRAGARVYRKRMEDKHEVAAIAVFCSVILVTVVEMGMVMGVIHVRGG